MEQQTLFPGYKPRKKKKLSIVREVAPRYWSDQEALSVILGAEAADGLLEYINGDLFELHNFEVEQLRVIHGIGPARALKIKAALELGRRIAQAKRPEKVSVSSPREIADFLMEEMRYYKKEYFKVVILNTKNYILSVENVSIGGLNSSIVHPREVFCIPLKRSAASIIVAHNHPTGDPAPSREDIQVTQRLVEAGRIIGIPVLDHIVIGDGRWFSFKEKGLIQ